MRADRLISHRKIIILIFFFLTKLNRNSLFINSSDKYFYTRTVEKNIKDGSIPPHTAANCFKFTHGQYYLIGL